MMGYLKLTKLSKELFSLIYDFNLSLLRLTKVFLSRIYLRFLARDLNIPNWHLNATFHARDYKSKVIKIYSILSDDINHVIEIGCGAGELISRINNTNKLGIDIDVNVLKLCNRLHPQLETMCLDVMKDFRELNRYICSLNTESNILVVMVNWLHIYPSKEANLLINNILNLNRKIILLVDIYSRKELSNRTDNKTKHDFSKLDNVKSLYHFKLIDKVRDFELLSNYQLKLDENSY